MTPATSLDVAIAVLVFTCGVALIVLVRVVQRLTDAVEQLVDPAAATLAVRGIGVFGIHRDLMSDEVVSSESLSASIGGGRRTAILFISTECSRCVDLASADLAGLAAARGVSLVTVVNGGDYFDIELFAIKHSMAGPVIGDIDGGIAARFEVTVVPTLALFDARGMIAQRHQPADAQAFLAAIHERAAQEVTAS